VNLKRSNRKSARIASPCQVDAPIQPFLLDTPEVSKYTLPLALRRAIGAGQTAQRPS
jgi:hypothetical protein